MTDEKRDDAPPQPQEVEFKALVGEHELSGVDHADNVEVEDNYSGGLASQLRFLMDGRIYVATEDPSDGYRSSLGSLRLVDGPPIKNTFAPVRVVGRVLDHSGYAGGSHAELLEFILVSSGEPVLTVGTENDDDYYPSCVLDFNPKVLGLVEGEGK